MSREIISYVRIDGPVSNLVNVDNKSLGNGITLLPVIYVTEQASHKLRLLHNDPSATPYSVAELAIYTGFDFGIAEDYAAGTDVPVRTQTGITVIEETWINSSDEQKTGASIVIPIDANTSELLTILGDKPFVYQQPKVDDLEVNVGAELLCFTATEIEPSLIVQYPFVFVNRRIKTASPPGTPGVDYLTPAQIFALYTPRSASNVDIGALLNNDDYFPVYNKDTGLVERYLISDLATGTQVPPVQNEYVDLAAMLADQGSQTAKYLQQAGADFYKKKIASTSDISNYDAIGGSGSGGPAVQGRYANLSAMFADQGNQVAESIYGVGSATFSFYVYKGTTTPDLSDYDPIGDMTLSVYDPAGIAEQVVGLTAAQSLSNKSMVKVVIEDYVDFTPQSGAIPHATGRFYYDADENCMIARNDISDVSLNVGEELWGRLTNDKAYTLSNGKVGYIKGAVGANLACDLADASSLDKSIRAFGLFTNDVLPGAQGYITRYGAVRDIDTSGCSEGDVLYVDPENPGEFINVRPSAPFYPVRIGLCLIADAVNGVVAVDTLAFNGSDTSVNLEGSINGVVIETPRATFFDDGGTIKAEIRNDDDLTKNLNFILDGIRYTLDTTTGAGPSGGAVVSLTPGATSTSLFENYIYCWLNGATPELKASTTSTPDEHAPVGKVTLFDYTRTIADGKIYKWRRFNDAQDDGPDAGAYRRLVDAIRNKLGTTYFSGIAGTVFVDSAPTVTISTTSGVAIQANEQAIELQDGTSYVVYNDNTNAATYEEVTDLSDIVETSQGGDLATNGAYYRLKVYIQSASPSDGALAAKDRLIVTRPAGFYGTSAEALTDANNYDTLINDINIEGLVFPIFTIVIGRTGGVGATWTEVATLDNRSRLVGGNTGGAGAQGSAGADELVKISSSDVVTGYLDDKLVVSTGLDKETLNSAANEQIQLKLADTAVTPGQYLRATVTVDQQGRITGIEEGSIASTSGYTPPSGTNAVVDTDPLTANTVSNTFAGTVDGTVTIPDTSLNGDKYFLWANGSAKVEVKLTPADTVVIADVVNSWGVICLEYDTVSSGYNVVRNILNPLFDGSTLLTEHFHEISGQVTKTETVNDTAGSIYTANGSGGTNVVAPGGAGRYFGKDFEGNNGAHDLPIPALRLQYDDTITAADPTSGKYRFNHATPGSATAIYISNSQVGGLAINTLIESLKANNKILLQGATAAANSIVINVTGTATDNTGWFTIPITIDSATGSFVDNELDLFTFMYPDTGDGSSELSSMVYSNANQILKLNKDKYEGNDSVIEEFQLDDVADFSDVDASSDGTENATDFTYDLTGSEKLVTSVFDMNSVKTNGMALISQTVGQPTILSNVDGGGFSAVTMTELGVVSRTIIQDAYSLDQHTSATSATGTATASSQQTGAREAWEAFKGVSQVGDDDCWRSDEAGLTAWLRYTLAGAAIGRTIIGYILTGVNSASFGNISDWTFIVDGSTVDTQVNYTAWGGQATDNTFMLSEPFQANTYFELNVTDSADPTNVYVGELTPIFGSVTNVTAYTGDIPAGQTVQLDIQDCISVNNYGIYAK